MVGKVFIHFPFISLVEGEHYKNWNDHGKVYICWIIVCVDHLEELRTEKVIQVEFSQIQLSE
jgi:hypothetical protein